MLRLESRFADRGKRWWGVTVFRHEPPGWYSTRTELWMWKHSACCLTLAPGLKTGRPSPPPCHGDSTKASLDYSLKMIWILPFHFCLCCSSSSCSCLALDFWLCYLPYFWKHSLNSMADRLQWVCLVLATLLLAMYSF